MLKTTRINALAAFMAAITAAPLAVGAPDRPTRENRVDRGLLRDNRLFAKADAEPPGKPLPGAPVMRSATKADIDKIRAVDRRYQKAKSVAMDVTKTLKISALNRERVSKGHALTSKGRIRFEIDSPDRSLLVVDGKTAWLVNYPSEEFKGAAVQVVKTEVSSKKAQSQAIVGLLAQGQFLKHFTVVGAQVDPSGEGASNIVYFLQPVAQLVEFTRAQARLSPDGKNLLELRYWDEIGNETDLNFANVRLNAPFSDSSFKYVPPKDADVTVM